MYQCIEVDIKNKKLVNLFLDFTNKLYNNKFKTNDKKTELQLLKGVY